MAGGPGCDALGRLGRGRVWCAFVEGVRQSSFVVHLYRPRPLLQTSVASSGSSSRSDTPAAGGGESVTIGDLSFCAIALAERLLCIALGTVDRRLRLPPSLE